MTACQQQQDMEAEGHEERKAGQGGAASWARGRGGAGPTEAEGGWSSSGEARSTEEGRQEPRQSREEQLRVAGASQGAKGEGRGEAARPSVREDGVGGGRGGRRRRGRERSGRR